MAHFLFRGRLINRLRVVSNFRDSREIHARARKCASVRRRAFRRPSSWRVSSREPIFARACILPESPKLETTRSLLIRHNLINNHPPLQAHFSSGRNSARKLGICCYEFVYNCFKVNSMFLTTGHVLTNVARVIEENDRKGNENCFELEVRVMEGSSYRR